jgi:hypothetical protein
MSERTLGGTVQAHSHVSAQSPAKHAFTPGGVDRKQKVVGSEAVTLQGCRGSGPRVMIRKCGRVWIKGVEQPGDRGSSGEGHDDPHYKRWSPHLAVHT